MLDKEETMPTSGISQKDKRKLKALAHHIDPCVQIGRSGVSAGVLAMINQALDNHELIKVQMLEASELDRKVAPAEIATAVKAELIQVIGFKFALYRFSKDAKQHVLLDDEET